MMKTADPWLCLIGADEISSHFSPPNARRLLVQPYMRSVIVVIADILEAEAHHVSLIHRDHVVQHLTAEAAHPSFRDLVCHGLRTLVRTGLIPLAFRNVGTWELNSRSRSKMM